MLQQLEREGRAPGADERRVLVKYVGWGGLPQLFTDDSPQEWAAHRERLRRLFTQDEYASARASTLNAHFTAPLIVMAMYDALRHFGFRHGRILEPALGLGHYFGLMPDEMREQSSLTGVELDSVTARMARLLYPDADIRHQGFEDAKLLDESFDVAISNVPFGDYSVADPQLSGFLVHDYFLAKAVTKLRPGGLLAFITSKGALDKADPKLRDHLINACDFLGAIRLPNTAFKQNANTEVTTDIVFLRKLQSGEAPAGPAWRNTAEHTNAAGERFLINEYFAEHPHMMLGTMAYTGGMHRGSEPVLEPDGRPLEDCLTEALQLLPANCYRNSQTLNLPTAPKADILAPDYVKENSYTFYQGAIAVRERDRLTLLGGIGEDRVRRIRGLIQLREAVREVLRTQVDGHSEEAVQSSREELNRLYDRFTAHHGPVNDRSNLRAFAGDPDLPLLLSLEDYDEEKKQATKTAVFFTRTVKHANTVGNAETPKDALILSLNEKGRVDLDYMEQLLGTSREEFLPELTGLIYLDPKTGTWETEDAYLSGNVRLKLDEARLAAETDPGYQANVAALEAAQLPDLKATEIDARLGAVWIPPEDIREFAASLLGSCDITVSHAHQIGTWFVRGDRTARASVANTAEWGTPRSTALDLIQDALNLKTPTVHDFDSSGDKNVINPAETEAARDKLEKIRERFANWIWEDDERRERLTALYNREFNNIRLRIYDGSHLTLPGSSPSIALRPHQKNAIWRIVQSENTMLAHVVGAGKTYTMCAAAMELKRLRSAHKPMFVVPNHMLGQFSSELLTLYPTANILVPGKDDFEATRRARLFARIATGNWDAVIVTHASFERIPVSLERRQRFIKAQIFEIETAVREQRGRGTRIVKELERTRKRLEVKLKALSADDRKDKTLTFEELGIDRLFIDEAHKFKNLFYTTKMTRVAGLPQTASERAFDLFLKVQTIQEQNGGVVFATGTPISNTMAEMFTMQRYLQMTSLRERRLQHFDSWAATFGETVAGMELNPNGSGYRIQSRFARFVNVPELMQMFRQVADIQTAEMLKLPIPKLSQGQPVTISAPVTPELNAYIDHLVKRTEWIKHGKTNPKTGIWRRVEPSEDNMLNITTDGRKAALDLRLVKPRARDSEHSKTNLAVAKIHEIWLQSVSVRGAQLVFCDLSTPQAGSFSVYDDLRTKLIDRGIPREEIAFIQDFDQDAAKANLFKAVREGKVRILFGSTSKMGEGTNVQTRLVALHHLDAPWRPSDIEQRDGRILRQGNRNEFVNIYRYVTEGSFDAYMWQTLETKARFIAQVMTGEATVRRAEDIESAALTYAEVKAIASGNPLVIEKAAIDAEVLRLTRLKKQHLESQFQMRHRMNSLGEGIALSERQIANLGEDIRIRQHTDGDAFRMSLKGQLLRERVEAGRALIFLAAATKEYEASKIIGEIGGFSISLQPHADSVQVLIHGKNTYHAKIAETPLGTISSIEHTLRSLEEKLRERQADLQHAHEQQKELARHIGLPFEYEDKLTNASRRQQEIVSALDLTRNQAAPAVESEESTINESLKVTTSPKQAHSMAV